MLSVPKTLPAQTCSLKSMKVFYWDEARAQAVEAVYRRGFWTRRFGLKFWKYAPSWRREEIIQGGMDEWKVLRA